MEAQFNIIKETGEKKIFTHVILSPIHAEFLALGYIAKYPKSNVNYFIDNDNWAYFPSLDDMINDIKFDLQKFN